MSDFVAENPLEEALIRAADDALGRPDFYRALTHAQLFIIDERPDAQYPGRQTLDQGTQLSIRTVDVEGTPHLAVFSSLPRIREAISSPLPTSGSERSTCFARCKALISS